MNEKHSSLEAQAQAELDRLIHSERPIVVKSVRVAEGLAETLLHNPELAGKYAVRRAGRSYIFGRVEVLYPPSLRINPQNNAQSLSPIPNSPSPPTMQNNALSVQIKPNARPTPLNVSGICPVCAEPKPLYELAGRWYCADCLNRLGTL